MTRLVALPLLLWTLLPQFSAAQARTGTKAAPAGTYKLQGLKVTGTERYNDKEILAATGLQIGQFAADGDFREAAKRLGDSGLFTDVMYSFAASGSGVRLEFQLSDIDASKLVPARFENFVWFTDEELAEAIRRQVPLFKQSVPVFGRLPDEISEALQVLLNDKKLPGRVDFLREGGQEGGDLKAVVYHVQEISTRIRNVEFPGATPEQSEFLANAIRRVSGEEYSRSALAVTAKLDLIPQFLQRGYLKATFGPSEARVVPRAEGDEHEPNDIEVDAVLPVTPGKQYMVSAVEFKGSAAISAEEASQIIHLATGRAADAVRLESDVESLRKVYHSRGYMTAQVKPEAQFDEEKATVHYNVDINEGDLYKMGELEILGVDSPSHDRLREAWTLQEGQPYNAEYTRKFLESAPRFLPSGARYSVNINEELSAKEKVVDVTIRFKMQ